MIDRRAPHLARLALPPLQIGASNARSQSNSSSAARSAGNNRTSSGSTSSHNDSAPAASSLNIRPSDIDQEPTYMQAIMVDRADGNTPSQTGLFPREVG